MIYDGTPYEFESLMYMVDGIPVPGASLPVIAFLLLGIYGKVIWLVASAIIIGIGHIGIHIQHLKALK